MKSPDINSDTEVNSEYSENPTSIKDNLIKNEMMNSVVTIKIDGKENPKGMFTENKLNTFTINGKHNN